jgi:membrane-associated phospholipid phosphatase
VPAATFAGLTCSLWILGVAAIGSTGTGWLQQFDAPVGAHLAVDPGSPVHAVAAALTWLGSALVLVPFALFVALRARRGRSWGPVVMAAVAVAGAEATTQALKYLVTRPRPSGAAAFGYAFPSGHTTIGAVVCFTTAALLPPAPPAVTRSRWVAAGVLALTVGWTRLALRVHWPSDVVLGLLVGVTWTFVARSVAAPAAGGPRPARSREA